MPRLQTDISVVYDVLDDEQTPAEVAREEEDSFRRAFEALIAEHAVGPTSLRVTTRVID